MHLITSVRAYMAAAVCADVQRASHLWRGAARASWRRGSPCGAVSAGDIATVHSTFLTRNLGFLDSSELTNFGILAHQAHRNMIRSIMLGFRGVGDLIFEFSPVSPRIPTSPGPDRENAKSQRKRGSKLQVAVERDMLPGLELYTQAFGQT